MEEVNAYQRHDITDRVWELLEPRLPGREGVWGGRAYDKYKFINAVFCKQGVSVHFLSDFVCVRLFYLLDFPWREVFDWNLKEHFTM